MESVQTGIRKRRAFSKQIWELLPFSSLSKKNDKLLEVKYGKQNNLMTKF